MLSAREAAEMLAVLGVRREPARRALLAGVAGPGIRTRGTLLYDRDRVEALLRAPVRPELLDDRCRRGMFVARVGPRRCDPGRGSGHESGHESGNGLDLTAPIQEQREAVRGGWELSAPTRVGIGARVEREGAVPFLATVSGFVGLGADIVGVEIDAERRATTRRGERVAFVLTDPGEWFAPLRGRRFVTPPGGPWTWWRAVVFAA